MTGLGESLLVWAACLLVAGLPQQPQQSLPLSALPVQLVGVMVDKETPSNSACLIRCTFPEGRQGRFLTGQTACDLAEIKEIRQEGVTINNLLTNRPELLTLSSMKPSRPVQPPPPAPVLAASQDVVAVELPKASVDYYVANLSELLDSAFATPRCREGLNGQRTIDGYEISRIREGGVAAQVGLRNGDVILELNGQALDGLATVVRLLGQVQSMAQAAVTVLRNGQRLTFVVKRK